MKTIIETIIRAAGSLAMDYFHKNTSLNVEEKGKLDLVTQADKDVETFILKQLMSAFPEDGFFGEEGNTKAGNSGRTWVIDPIDGTFNFVRGSTDWAISIGLYDNNKPIYGAIYAPFYNQILLGGQDQSVTLNTQKIIPSLDYQKDRGCVGIGMSTKIESSEKLMLLDYLLNNDELTFRYFGSATTTLMKVATGELDGYISLGDSSWDIMAGVAILDKLGHHTSIDFNEFSLEKKLKFICGKPELVQKVSSSILKAF